jgi:hypothetical protein
MGHAERRGNHLAIKFFNVDECPGSLTPEQRRRLAALLTREGEGDAS